jgi:hypothetical protein
MPHMKNEPRFITKICYECSCEGFAIIVGDMSRRTLDGKGKKFTYGLIVHVDVSRVSFLPVKMGLR